VEENSTEVLSLEAEDPEGSAIALSLTGGADQGLVSLDENNNLSFNSAPNFESPSDDNGDNVYQVQVTADDGNGGTSSQNLEITVTNTNEAPIFEQASFTLDINPNQADSFSKTVRATDPEAEEVSFEITEGNNPDSNETDAFSIDNEGVITVADAAELESQDIFNLTVEASDGDLTSTAKVEINAGATSPEFNLDVDGNDQVSSLTDGLIIFRHIATNGDTSTYEDNLGSGATVPIGDIETALNEVTSPQGLLDVDGNDQVSSLTDGLIIFRHIATNGDTSTYEDNLGSGATLPIEDIASSLDSLII
jgi:hypothetical protein